jgi:hypothetical protein
MKTSIIGSVFLLALALAGCGGVDGGNGHNSNTAIKTNSAGPSTGTTQPNTNAGTNSATNANIPPVTNSNSRISNNANH